ncbi:MAG: nuclear transport factor 2 family protein [Granulosicoccus sp.]
MRIEGAVSLSSPVGLFAESDSSESATSTVSKSDCVDASKRSPSMDKAISLMADDMVWQNEGDNAMPWIGPWNGKDEILKFLPIFSNNFQTTAWDNTDAFALGDTVAVFGRMNGITTHSGKEIGEFSFALRAKVRDGKVVLWNWFEDSFAVSQAYNAK